MPRKTPEPRPVIRTNRDVAKARTGWNKVSGATGLYLVCDPPNKKHPDGGLKRWMLRYARPTNGKMNEIGIGHLSKGVDLDKARAAWMDCQFHLRHFRDPQEVRKISRGQRVTFTQCAEMFIKAHGPGKSESWLSNAKLMYTKHAPRLANEAVATISSSMVEEAIAPLMAAHPAQARLALAAWETLFDFAKAKGFRTFDNPAKWKGLHKHLFAGQQRISSKHHPALAYWDMKAFMSELRQHQAYGIGAIALEMMILTVCRPNKEVRLMQWDEIDWVNKIWTCPAERMKTRVTHRVPLVDRAMTLLDLLRDRGIQSPYVFTGRFLQKPLAQRAMLNLMRNMGISKDKADVHGFRRTFRSWCAVNKFDYATSEMCLAHTVGKPHERAYWDTDLLNERREIMNAWAAYIG